MTYVKKNQITRRKWIIGISFLLIVSAGITAYNLLPKQSDLPVFQEEFVIKLPSALPSTQQQPIKPFKEGIIAVDYFNGTSQDVVSVVEYEGVYRPSQGIDISYNQTAFDIVSAFDGIVVDVKKDPMLGDSVQVSTGEYIITYQCLSDIQVEKGSQVKQNDLLGKASTNLYQSELGNHLHLVVEKNDKIIDPKLLIPLN